MKNKKTLFTLTLIIYLNVMTIYASPIHEAIKASNIEEVRRLINEDPNCIQQLDENGKTPWLLTLEITLPSVKPIPYAFNKETLIAAEKTIACSLYSLRELIEYVIAEIQSEGANNENLTRINSNTHEFGMIGQCFRSTEYQEAVSQVANDILLSLTMRFTLAINALYFIFYELAYYDAYSPEFQILRLIYRKSLKTVPAQVALDIIEHTNNYIPEGFLENYIIRSTTDLLFLINMPHINTFMTRYIQVPGYMESGTRFYLVTKSSVDLANLVLYIYSILEQQLTYYKTQS